MNGARLLTLGLFAGTLFGCGGCGGSSGANGSNSSSSSGTTATPTFSPPAGQYSTAQSVRISDATAGTTIYYTTDGSTPGTTSTKYSGPLSLSANTTVKAIAEAVGGPSSAVATAAYSFASGNHTYSSTFQNTEDPLTESGNWVNGKVNGLLWNNCRSASGMAFGTQPGTINYDDSICALTGTWSTNQSVQATIKVNSTSNAQFDEVEVFLNLTITANSATGYEINCSVAPGGNYLQIVRWDGGLGKFTYVGGTNVGCASGDVLSAKRLGSTITAYKNGTAVATATDSTFTGGSPGMGFYIQTLSGTADAANAGFGFTSFSASD